jgi:hypothetical protein
MPQAADQRQLTIARAACQHEAATREAIRLLEIEYQHRRLRARTAWQELVVGTSFVFGQTDIAVIGLARQNLRETGAT